ncbi:hypothetical protein GLUCORHAEAF1_00025 [Komagataeibacter rhaeticus AF1]|nr:hypothetical protein GLUCORHAEAF1_00025 [Komagataeibacter rhaeticus AF1]
MLVVIPVTQFFLDRILVLGKLVYVTGNIQALWCGLAEIAFSIDVYLMMRVKPGGIEEPLVDAPGS